MLAAKCALGFVVILYFAFIIPMGFWFLRKFWAKSGPFLNSGLCYLLIGMIILGGYLAFSLVHG